MSKDIRIAITGEDHLSPVAQKAAEALKRLHGEISELDKKTIDVKAKINELTAAKSAASKGVFDVDVVGSKKLRAELEKLIGEYKRLEEEKAKAARGSKAIYSDALKKKQAEIVRVYNDAINQQKRAVLSLTNAKKRLIGAVNAETAAVKKSVSAMEREKSVRNSAVNALVRHIRQMESFAVAIYGAKKAYDATMGVGHDFNKLLEEEKLGLTALIMTKLKNVDATGRMLSVQEKWRIASEMGEKAFKRLLELNKQTPHDLGQTIQIFRVLTGTSLQYSGSMEKMYKLTKLISIAAAAQGVAFQPLLASIDGLATGTVKANSDLGKFLTSIGITNEKLKSFASGSERIDFIIKKLSEFAIAGEKSLNNWSRVTTNFSTQWKVLWSEIEKPLDDFAKKKLIEFTDYISKNKDEIVTNVHDMAESFKELTPAIKAGFALYAVSRAITLYEAFTETLKGATAAQLAFNVASKANPYILLATTLTAVFEMMKRQIGEIDKLYQHVFEAQTQAEVVSKMAKLKAQLEEVNEKLKDGVSLWDKMFGTGNTQAELQQRKKYLEQQIVLLSKRAEIIKKSAEEEKKQTKGVINVVNELKERYKALKDELTAKSGDPYKTLRLQYEKYLQKYQSDIKKDAKFKLLIDKWYYKKLQELREKDVKRQQEAEKQKYEEIYQWQDKNLDLAQQYYEDLGELDKAWLIEEHKIREKYAMFDKKSVDEIAKRHKEAFFNKMVPQTKEASNEMARAVEQNFFDYMTGRFRSFKDFMRNLFNDILSNIVTPFAKMLSQSISGAIMGGLGGILGGIGGIFGAAVPSVAGTSLPGAVVNAIPAGSSGGSLWGSLGNMATSLIYSPSAAIGQLAGMVYDYSPFLGQMLGGSANVLAGGGSYGMGFAGGLGGVLTAGGLGYLGGNLLDKLFGAETKAGIGGGVGAAIGSLIPGVGTIVGGLIGSVLGGLFGKWKVTDKGVRFKDDAWSGHIDADYYIKKKKKSWFHTSRKTDYKAMPESVRRQIDAMFASYDFLFKQMEEFGKRVEISAGKYSGESFTDALAKDFLAKFMDIPKTVTKTVTKTVYDWFTYESETIKQEITSENPKLKEVYDVWKDYAKQIDKSVGEAITQAFSDYVNTTRSFEVWRLNFKGDTIGALKKQYEFAKADLVAIENMLNVSGVTIDNYLKIYKGAMKSSPTPETIKKWQALGEALQKVEEAEKRYKDAIEQRKEALEAQRRAEEAAREAQRRAEEAARAQREELYNSSSKLKEYLIKINEDIRKSVVSMTENILSAFIDMGRSAESFIENWVGGESDDLSYRFYAKRYADIKQSLADAISSGDTQKALELFSTLQTVANGLKSAATAIGRPDLVKGVQSGVLRDMRQYLGIFDDLKNIYTVKLIDDQAKYLRDLTIQGVQAHILMDDEGDIRALLNKDFTIRVGDGWAEVAQQLNKGFDWNLPSDLSVFPNKFDWNKDGLIDAVKTVMPDGSTKLQFDWNNDGQVDITAIIGQDGTLTSIKANTSALTDSTAFGSTTNKILANLTQSIDQYNKAVAEQFGISDKLTLESFWTDRSLMMPGDIKRFAEVLHPKNIAELDKWIRIMGNLRWHGTSYLETLSNADANKALGIIDRLGLFGRVFDVDESLWDDYYWKLSRSNRIRFFNDVKKYGLIFDWLWLMDFDRSIVGNDLPNLPSIPGFADGGIVTSPTYALIGEAGYPEAVIPMKNGRDIPVNMHGTNKRLDDLIVLTEKQAKEIQRMRKEITDLNEKMKAA